MEMSTPTIAAERVTLREFCDDDVDLVLSVVDDPLIPFITTVPEGGKADDALAYIRRQQSRARSGEGLQFAVVDNSSRTAVGQIGLTFQDAARERASLGYWISPLHRGQGFAAAALGALSTWAFELTTMERLELYVEPWNEGSWRAATSAGFSREGLLRSWERVGTERRDMYMYSRLRHS
jgi:ribosomal-protein-alanine N-acetyltransferase